MSDTLSPEVRAHVDVHLDAVESQLRTAGAYRTQRRGVVDDLETQILDILAAQKEGVAWAGRCRRGSAAGSTRRALIPTNRPGRLSRTRRPRQRGAGNPDFVARPSEGAWCPGGELFRPDPGGSDVDTGLLLRGCPPPPPPFWYQLLMRGLLVAAAVAGIVGPVLGTGLGWVAVERIRESNGRLYGTALAVIEALLFPLILIWLGTYAFEYWVQFTIFGHRAVMELTVLEREKLVAYRLVWIVVAVVLSAGLAWILRSSTRPKLGGGSRAATQTRPASVLASSNG